MTKPLTAERAREVVVQMYLDTGNDHTVKEIAAAMGCGESALRKVLEDRRGFCLDGLTSSVEARASYSKAYANFESGQHRVRVYGPTRELLRTRLQALTTVRPMEAHNS